MPYAILATTVDNPWLVRDYLALVAIFISVTTGIIYPFAKFIHRKYFEKAQLDIIPFNKTSFIFNESGSYAKLKFSIHCKKRDVIINKITLKITASRNSKTETLNLFWNFFEPVQLNWLGQNMSNSINTTAYARPIKIQKDGIEPCIIEFSNNNQTVVNKLNDLSIKKDDDIKIFFTSLKDSSKDDEIITVQEVIDGFKLTKDYSTLFNDYEKYFFWYEGTYLLELEIEYDKSSVLNSKIEFVIDSEDLLIAKENIDKTIFCRLRQQNNISPGFNPLQKDMIKKAD